MFGSTYHCLCNYNIVLFIMLGGKCLIQFNTILKAFFRKRVHSFPMYLKTFMKIYLNGDQSRQTFLQFMKYKIQK